MSKLTRIVEKLQAFQEKKEKLFKALEGEGELEVLRSLWQETNSFLLRCDVPGVIAAIENLNSLIGMAKPYGPCDQVADILQLMLLEDGNPEGHMYHFMGTGPPGVGKTTFFERLGLVINRLKILQKEDHPVLDFEKELGRGKGMIELILKFLEGPLEKLQGEGNLIQLARNLFPLLSHGLCRESCDECLRMRHLVRQWVERQDFMEEEGERSESEVTKEDLQALTNLFSLEVKKRYGEDLHLVNNHLVQTSSLLSQSMGDLEDVVNFLAQEKFLPYGPGFNNIMKRTVRSDHIVGSGGCERKLKWHQYCKPGEPCKFYMLHRKIQRIQDQLGTISKTATNTQWRLSQSRRGFGKFPLISRQMTHP